MPLAIYQEFNRSVEVFLLLAAQRCLIFNQNAQQMGSRRTRIELLATPNAPKPFISIRF
jgi:hypothetical protein